MAAHNHHGAQAPGLAEPERARVPAAGLAPLGALGASAAVLTPAHNDEAPGWQAEGDEGNTEPSSHDSAHHAPGAQPANAVAAAEKAFSTLQARLALRGFALTRTDGAGCPVVYTVTRWGLMRELASLDDVAALAERVGAPA